MAQATAARTGYPRIPAKNWWDLRHRFKQSPPRQVDGAYLQTVLSLSEKAASNLLPSLRAAGLIDEGGQPTQRALDWRDDDHYKQICEEILREAYPAALLDALPGPAPDRDRVEGWFARQTGTGQANARSLASFYLLLCQGDPSAADQSPEAVPPRGGAPRSRPVQGRPRRHETPAPAQTAGPVTPLAPRAREEPAIHIDINIHIDSSSSPEQIDQILASMARHLYRGEG